MTVNQPNIILIMSDDLGYEVIGANGGTSYKTPYLDEMAQGGIRFENAHVMPLCTPTRVSLMTGKYNFRNYIGFGLINPEEVTFGHLLSDAGYNTCISGKWQLFSYNPPDERPEKDPGTRFLLSMRMEISEMILTANMEKTSSAITLSIT